MRRNTETGIMAAMMSRLLPLLIGLLFLLPQARAEVHFLLPRNHLVAEELAVVVNDNDPLSVRIGEYYRQARGIPERNVIHVRFTPGTNNLPPNQFRVIKQAVDAATPESVQAFALTWVNPFRVGCLSMTSAFTFGFDKRYCAADRCQLNRDSPYFDYPTRQPYRDLGIRPAMVIAATRFEDARALIDRGIASDGTHPAGTAYLVSTADPARNVRHVVFPKVREVLGDQVTIETVETPRGIRDRDDVLFYFTGVRRVPDLETLRFHPGAMADHLTSHGGRMPESSQMNVLEWLRAGATGSYGTVIEPCNHLQKFPNPGVAIQTYLSGATLIEAYWKSVQQPAQGIFVGEPLARPFGGHRIEQRDNLTILHTHDLLAGHYRLQYAPAPIGPFHTLGRVLSVPRGSDGLRFSRLADGVYRLIRLEEESPAEARISAVRQGAGQPAP